MTDSYIYNRRTATSEIFARYLELMSEISCDPYATNERLSLQNLKWICQEGVDKYDQLPIDKLSRWLGFVQGCLCMRGLISVDEERDFTRLRFHRAYREEGIQIPDVHERG